MEKTKLIFCLFLVSLSVFISSCFKNIEVGPVVTFDAPPVTEQENVMPDYEKILLQADKVLDIPVDNSETSVSESTSAAQSSVPADISSDLVKLQTVFSKLSPRCKNGIKNGKPEEFLKDLNAVLAADKDNLLMLCDKTHYLPERYEPSDLVLLKRTPEYNVEKNEIYLRACAIPSLKEMGADAAKQGLTLLVSSTYRSYDRQKIVYDRLVAIDGQEEADRESARPGTSQHQTGAVIDFGNIDSSYEQTAPGKWLLKNASKYGWSLSFPAGYEDVTGYRYECWHYRYIGKIACDFQKKWFSDVQLFMLEFIDEWKKIN